MRNGNFVRLKYEWNLLIRSYPTYEEWKLFLAISQSSTHFRSYPTYEEWKHMMIEEGKITDQSSYPTYEEWKPSVNGYL